MAAEPSPESVAALRRLRAELGDAAFEAALELSKQTRLNPSLKALSGARRRRPGRGRHAIKDERYLMQMACAVAAGRKPWRAAIDVVTEAGLSAECRESKAKRL